MDRVAVTSAGPSQEELRRCMGSPGEFRKILRVDTDVGKRIFSEILDPWQRADFERLDRGWQEAVLGRPAAYGDGGGGEGTVVYQRAYLERPRGHSKTTDLAVMVAWALFASRRRLTGNAVAADKEQARLLRTAIRGLIRANAWLSKFIDAQRDKVINLITGSELHVLSSDAPTAYGQTPDFVICDELTHWTNRETWSAVFSSAAKRKFCILVIISNAGVGRGKSWQWLIREAARESERWYFSRLDGPVASWIGAVQLREQESLLPVSAYRRLWLNQWIDDSGDALDPQDIEAARTLEDWTYQPEPGWVYGAGLDLGVRRDHAALVVVGAKMGTGRVRVARSQRWQPRDQAGGERVVDLIAVREATLEAWATYGLVWVGFDPSQAELMSQELRGRGVPMEPMNFVGKNLHLMASSLMETFRDRRIELVREGGLVDDLRRLSIVEKKFGMKLEAISDESGHADEAIALSIILPVMMEISSTEAGVFPEDNLPSIPDRVVT